VALTELCAHHGDDMSHWSACRIFVKELLESKQTECILCFVILFNAVIVVGETNVGASADGSPAPIWLIVAGTSVTAIFVCEIILRLFVYRFNFWEDSIRVMDFVVVFLDLLFEVLSILALSDDYTLMSVLRMLRLIKLVRTVRVVLMFPELRDLISCLFSASKITFWGSVFIGCIILFWSILGTQLIHPIARQLKCQECSHAWTSVWQSSITITQLMLANDAWGEICNPVIQDSPWTLVFFVAMLLSANLLILNLILAVIVQHAQIMHEKYKELDRDKEKMKRATAHAKLIHSLEKLDADKRYNF